MSTTDFLTVTELSGDAVSREQLERIRHRYAWVAEQCRNKRALDLACGTGQGLGLLQSVAAELLAGDYSLSMLTRANAHYGNRLRLLQLAADQIPFPDSSIDVISLLEAIYYLPSVEAFVDECRRVLTSSGNLLIVTANKDLYDFQPSPFSYSYYGAVGLNQLLVERGFKVQLFGAWPLQDAPFLQKLLRPVKKAATLLDLIPKTMAGKKLLKRLIFGSLVPMPAEITVDHSSTAQLQPLMPDRPDRKHKVIYCIATVCSRSQRDARHFDR